MPTKRRTIKTKPKSKTSRPTRAKSGSNAADIKAMVSQMARAAIKSQTSNYQGNSSVLGNIGMMAGNGISKIFGLGAYKLQSNSLYDSRTGSQVPFMHSTDESVVFRHREYIGEISSSVGFVATTFPVNPGLSTTFPYLQAIASSFQEYKFRGLVFSFKSTGATSLVSGTNTAMGSVMLAAQYRADAPTFSSKVELLNEMWSVDSKTSEDCLLPIECAPKENPMSVQYVRTGDPTGDVKLFDLCNITVATQGSQAANIIGELWVSYEIELYKPAVTPSGGVIATFHCGSVGNGTAPFGYTGFNIFTNTLDIRIQGNILTFPPNTTGKFLVQCYHFGTAAVFSPGAVTLDANMSLQSAWYNNSTGRANTPDAGVSSTNVGDGLLLTLTPLAKFTNLVIANGTYPGGASKVDIYVSELVDTFT